MQGFPPGEISGWNCTGFTTGSLPGILLGFPPGKRQRFCRINDSSLVFAKYLAADESIQICGSILRLFHLRPSDSSACGSFRATAVSHNHGFPIGFDGCLDPMVPRGEILGRTSRPSMLSSIPPGNPFPHLGLDFPHHHLYLRVASQKPPPCINPPPSILGRDLAGRLYLVKNPPGGFTKYGLRFLQNTVPVC